MSASPTVMLPLSSRYGTGNVTPAAPAMNGAAAPQPMTLMLSGTVPWMGSITVARGGMAVGPSYTNATLHTADHFAIAFCSAATDSVVGNCCGSPAPL